MKLRSIICVSAIAAAASASALTSTNTFARLPIVGNTFENALIAIPLAGCGEDSAAIYVTNLVMTSNLKQNDTLIYKNGGAFYAWHLESDGGEWCPYTISSTKSGTSTTPNAAQTLLNCGEGCWLVRSGIASRDDKNIYLFGQVNDGSVTTRIPAGSASAITYAVVGRPFETAALDLYDWKPTGVAEGDTITIPLAAAPYSKTFTYKSGNWTYQTTTSSGKTGKKGSGAITVSDTNVADGEVQINPGVAFMYGRKGDSELVITWTK